MRAFTSGDLPMACMQGTRQPTQTSRSSSDWTRPGSRRTRVWKVGGGLSSQWPGLAGYSAAVNDELNKAQESRTNEDGAIPAQSRHNLPLLIPARDRTMADDQSAQGSCELHVNGRRPHIKLDRQTVHLLDLPTCMT